MGPGLNGFMRAIGNTPGSDPLAAIPELVQHRGIDQSPDRPALLDQRNVHGELAVAGDELLGTIQRIHQPVAGPAAPCLHRLGVRLFRQHMDIRRQAGQRLHYHLVRPLIGGGERTLVLLVLHRKGLTVDGQDGVTGGAGDGLQCGNGG
ncbi:hypothetical protein D3C72_1786650 [compost metagenome]